MFEIKVLADAVWWLIRSPLFIDRAFLLCPHIVEDKGISVGPL